MKFKRPLIVSIIILIVFVWVSIFSVQGNGLAQVLQNEVYLPLVLKPAAPTVVPTPTVGPTSIVPTAIPHEGTMIIDHNSVALYDRIPAQYLRAAEALRVLYRDRSVGGNISDGLSCLAYPNWESSPANCRRDYIDSSLTEWKTFSLNDSNIPSAILFPGGNNRDNIQVIMEMGTWEEDLSSFISDFPSYTSSKDIITYQHNYLHVDVDSTIDNVYFDLNYNGTNIYDLVALENQFPNKTFIYWTSSLSRNVGTADSQSFNDQMRAWAVQNGKILFDVADIESHDLNNNPCYDNRDGVEYCTQNGECENHLDDGVQILAICREYTTEVDGGHLGSVSAGKIRIAKAMWVMLAQIAGWNP